MSLKKKLLSNPYIALLKIAWQYANEKRNNFLLIYCLFFLSALLYSAMPIVYGMFINQLQMEGTAIIRSVWIYAGLVFFIHFGEWLFHGPARVMERELAFEMGQNFLRDAYHKTLHLPVEWHQDHHSGATINRVRKAYEALKSFFESGFEYVHAIFKFLIAFIAMIYFAPLFGIIALGFGVLIIYVIFRFDKYFIATLEEVNEREHVVSSTLFDSLSNIITVITLRLEKRMEKGLMQKVDLVLPPFRSNVRINEWKWFVVDTLVTLIYMIILVGFVYQNYVPGEVFMIGTLVTVMSYVDRFTSIFHNVAYLYTNVVRYHTDVQSSAPIFEAYQRLSSPQGAVLPHNWQQISIEGLNFSHRSGQTAVLDLPVLSNLSIRIERGKKIALIGESGSGKSSLLALLRGLYFPERGIDIRVDEACFSQLNVISSQVTLFPQEPEIFENTIAYNITLGLPFSTEAIEEVCRVVQFQEVVQQLPKGLASGIQEKGVNLSGGQKQRLALARGVFAAQESDIILLDEPTSSVDPMTEIKIYDRLFERFADKAIISALHRLHLLPKFDYIYVLQNGMVVDEGSFSHLRQYSKAFQTLWKHQEQVSR